MAQAGTVWVDVRGDTAALTRDIAAVAVAAGAVTIGAFGAQAVKEATAFNKAVSGVGAVANASAADLELYRQAALKAGADTAYSASEAATAQAELAKAGLSTADVLGGGLSGALSLAAAGQIELADAAVYTSQALNVFGLDGADAAHVADVLAAGAVKSAADVGQLGQALQQGGLVAKQTGLTLEDTVGVLSLFADNALIGSDAGTSLKTMLQRLVPQTAEAADAMSALGLSFFDTQGQFVGIEGVAAQLQGSLRGLSTEQRQQALTTLFGADAIRAASLLYEAGAAGVDEYTRAVNDQGAAQRVASQQLDNLAGDLEALSGSWETLLIGLGSSADSGLRDVVQSATEAVNQLGEFVQSPAFDAFAEQLGAVFGSVADDIGMVGDRLNAALADIDASDIEGFFRSVGDAVDGLEGPIAGLGVALSTMAASALPALGRLVPGITPLQGVLAGLVLQSEEGRDALLAMGDAVGEIGQAATPVLGVLADVLGFVADQGELVKVAFNTFLAYKIVQTVSPWVASVRELGASFVDLGRQVSNIAATRGVSQLEALRGVVGSSTSEGLSGALTTANVATAGLTAVVSAGLYIYQDWANEQAKVEQATRDLTSALLEQADVAATTQLARAFSDLLDENDEFAEAFSKSGLAISDFTNLINTNAADVKKAADEYLALPPGDDYADILERRIEDMPDKVEGFVRSLVALRDSGAITEKDLRRLLEAMGGVAERAAGSADLFNVRARAFKAEAEGANLSAEAQRQLAVALDENASIEARRDALDYLATNYRDLAEAAGFTATATEESAAAASTAVAEFTPLGGLFDTLTGNVNDFAGATEEASASMLDLLDAQDSMDDAGRRVADAQEKLTDIINQNTEAVRNARDTVTEARQALNEALADTGPGSRAARDALSEVRQAMRALRELQIEAGKTSPGDWIEDRSADIEDQLYRIADAQQKYQDIVSGNTDEVRDARDRLADAESKLNEELANTGPNSKAARDATEELDDATRNAARATEDYETAMGSLSTEAIPENIESLNDLAAQYGLSRAEVDRLAAAMLNELAIRQELNRTPVVPYNPFDGVFPGAQRSGQPLSGAPSANRPGGALPGTSGAYNPFLGVLPGGNKTQPRTGDNPDIITRDEGLPLGLGTAPGDFNASAVYDVYGREWVWKKDKYRWYRLGAGRAYGGPVDPDRMYPVNELGDPEIYESVSGDRYLLPAEAGQVVPLKKAPIPDAGSGLRGNGAYDHGPARYSAVMPDQGGERFSAVMPDQGGERWSAVMPDRELTAEIRALRGDLVSTVRYLARTISPGAGEELTPVLRDIERNTRASYAPSARAVQAKAVAFA